MPESVESTDSRVGLSGRATSVDAASSATATPLHRGSASFTATLSRKWPLFGPMVPLKLAVGLTITELRPFGRDFVLMSLNHVVEAGKVVAAAPFTQYRTLLVVIRKIGAEAGPAESVVPRDLQEFFGVLVVLSPALLGAMVVQMADVALLGARRRAKRTAATAAASASATPPIASLAARRALARVRVPLVAGLVNVVVPVLSGAPVVTVAARRLWTRRGWQRRVIVFVLVASAPGRRALRRRSVSGGRSRGVAGLIVVVIVEGIALVGLVSAVLPLSLLQLLLPLPELFRAALVFLVALAGLQVLITGRLGAVFVMLSMLESAASAAAPFIIFVAVCLSVIV